MFPAGPAAHNPGMKSGAQDVVETQAGSGFRAWGPGLCGMLVVIALLAGSSRPAGAAMRTPLEVPRKAADRSAASNQENPSPAPLVIESLPVSVEPFAPSYHPQAPVPIVIDLEGGAGASIDLAWNADPACFDGIEAGAAAGAPEDLDGFSDLVAILSAERIIDPSRIYVSGPTDALAPPACVPRGPRTCSPRRGCCPGSVRWRS